MKKTILILALSMLSATIYAQDCSKRIVKKTDELKGKVEYQTPLKALGKYRIFATKTFINNIEIRQICFSFGSSSSDYSKGVYIKLMDGTIIKNENATTDCNYFGSGRYQIIGILDLDEEMIEKLLKSPIEKFKIGNTDGVLNEKSSKILLDDLNCLYKD